MTRTKSDIGPNPQTGIGPFTSKKQAAEHKWFSRRHETREAHETAGALRAENRDEQLRGVACRTSRRAKRSASDQLAVLDARLGEGMGATRERARLQALIDAA